MRITAGLLALALILHLGIPLKVLSVGAPNPVAYFPLNAENQTREIDGRSLEGDAVEVALAPGPDGRANGSYELFGYYSSITFPNNDGGTLDVRYSVTMLCWAFRTGHYGHFLSYVKFDDYYAFFKVSLEFEGDSLFGYIEDRDDPSTNITVSTPFTSRGVWTHVGMSYNNVTGELNLFFDGRLAATYTSPVGGITLPLGTQYDLCSGGYNGRITQARVYDVALTEDQVQMVYCGYSDIYTNPSANINCGNRGSDITIIIHGVPDVDRWNGTEASWRINDANNSACQPVFGVCNVSYGPLDGKQCATLVNTSNDFSYTFQINATDESSASSSQPPNHSYSFTCKYGKDGTPAVDGVPEPVAYYPLNGEYQTSEILERTLPGYPYDVSLAPGPDGSVNGSYEFFGYFSKIAFGECGCETLNVRHSITLLCWVFIRRNDHHGHLLSFVDYDHGFTVSLEFYGDLLEAYINDDGLDIVLATPFTSKGRWSHVGMSYNNFTGELNLFMDGRLTATHSSPVEGIVLDTEFSELCSVEYHGRITQARVYDVALTEDQVQMVYCGYSDIYNKPSANVRCGVTAGENITIIIHGIPDVELWIGREDDWRLNDANSSACQPSFGVCNVSYGPFNGEQCATLTSTSTDLTYTFQINAIYRGDSPVQAYDHRYLITCNYGRAAQASFIPLHNVRNSTTGRNDLSFAMELYSDNARENVIIGTVPLRSVIYVRVTLAYAFLGALDLLISECYTSTSSDERRSMFIQNSCATGNNFNVNYNCSRQIGVTEDFNFVAHRFPSQSDDNQSNQVWFRCGVYACLANDSTSLCRTQCSSDCSGRRRRGIGRFKDGRNYQVSFGPYRFAETREGQIDTTEEEEDRPALSGRMLVVLSVCGVVGLAICICTTVVLILRKRMGTVVVTQNVFSEIAIDDAGRDIDT